MKKHHHRGIRRAALVAAAGFAVLAAGLLPADALAQTRAARPAYEVSEGAAAGEGSVSAAELLAKVTACTQISSGKYRKDAGGSATVPVCQKDGAVFWKADMDIDCDGQPTTNCNATTDPYFQSATSFQQSDGKQLNAETLPFIVVPVPSTVWDYRASGIVGGSVVAVIHNDQVHYGVVGDTGPSGIIGEASYGMAKALGINPHPQTGGIASGVTYIVFTNTRVAPIESHAGAVTLGEAMAEEFVNLP